MTIDQQATGEHPPATPHEPEFEQAESTMLELLDRVGSWSPPPANVPPGAGAEILFDLLVDGARYQLLRIPQHETAVSLSSRELEIARMIANGHTNRTVAAVLDISPWTVSTHLRRVFAKLNVGSRAAMVAVLVAEGVFTPTEEESARNGHL